MNDLLAIASDVINIEIDGLKTVRDQLGDTFVTLVNQCVDTLNRGGKLVFTGIGKSGHIGRKMAATAASTGSPSVFMHPVEALHGDIGMMQKNDLLIALSYSGETEELITTLKPAKRLGIPIVAITGYGNSTLAKIADLTVEMPVPREACPFNLAPTTSTTALLAIGDALAIALLKVRGFTKEDFGRLHPGGAIGRVVTMRARDIMRTQPRCAVVAPDCTVREALSAMGEARCGAAVVADAGHKVLGIFTDGDFRRSAAKDITVLTKPIASVMTVNPTTICGDAMAVTVLKTVEERHINSIIVVDSEQKLLGLIDVQDLPGLKLM